MTRKPLVYVAGPFSSDPVGNTRTATTVGQSLWRSGLATAAASGGPGEGWATGMGR